MRVAACTTKEAEAEASVWVVAAWAVEEAQGCAGGQRSEQQRRRRVEEKQRRRRVEEQRGGEHRMDKVELGLGGIEIWIGLV